MMIVDRVENDIVVIEVEGSNFIELPLSVFSEGISEGDILKLTVDIHETELRHKKVEKKLNRLFNKRT